MERNEQKIEAYNKLLDDYRLLLEDIDIIHFNSINTKSIYSKFIKVPEKSQVVTISHSGIIDNRQGRVFKDDLLRLGFIGNETPYKGLPLLVQIVKELIDSGFSGKLILNCFGNAAAPDHKYPSIRHLGRFSSSELPMILNQMDLLVVPSIWHETFSFVTLEALSYGLPVMVSDRVGAKDIVANYDKAFIYKNKEELYEKIRSLIMDREPLRMFNKSILLQPFEYTLDRHSEEIVYKIYNS